MQHYLSENQENLVKKAAYLRIIASELAEGMKSGNFRSQTKGHGIEFSGVRDYIRGDDIRSIDWNVTARMGKPYVKVFEEERELQIFVIVDSSLSMQIKHSKISKYECAAQSAALVSIASEMNGCPCGGVFFDGAVYFSSGCQAGREQTMLMLTHLDKLADKPVIGSAMEAALKGADKLLRKRSLVFIFSDFRTSGWEKAFASLAHKNDVIAFRIQSPDDERLPAIGTARFEDVESGKIMELPSALEKFQRSWKIENEHRVKNWQDFCLKHGAYPYVMNCSDDPLRVLSSVFVTHGKR